MWLIRLRRRSKADLNCKGHKTVPNCALPLFQHKLMLKQVYELPTVQQWMTSVVYIAVIKLIDNNSHKATTTKNAMKYNWINNKINNKICYWFTYPINTLNKNKLNYVCLIVFHIHILYTSGAKYTFIF